MELKSFGYGYEGELALGFDEAVARTKEALARHGFGVQAEIAISQALKTKLQVDVPREVILGVCNPALAYRAIQADSHVTVLLPCNIAIRESGAGVHVATANAGMLVDLTGNPGLAPVAAEAENLLKAALGEL